MAATQMAEKPAYLGLLNAISLAETNAGVYLQAWANATDDEELAETLRFVAARETSHGEVFCRRIAELGFELQHKTDPEAAANLVKLANPKIPDCEKIGPERPANNQITDFFTETEQKVAAGEYDAMTANLLTWYIAEERDSGKRLKRAYDRVRARMNMGNGAAANGAMKNGNGAAHDDAPMAMTGPSSDAQAIMACMTDGFARLEKTLRSFASTRR